VTTPPCVAALCAGAIRAKQRESRESGADSTGNRHFQFIVEEEI